MADIFSEVKLQWGGADYIVPPNDVMRVIAIIENHISLGDLERWSRTNSVPLGRLSMAYGAVLRFAGARVSDPEIYASMFKSGEMGERIARAIGDLLLLMIPPDAAKEAAAGKPGAAVVAAPSSKPRTKPRSVGG
jgi:hypothetical protein